MKHHINIDIETYSDENIKTVGAFNYARSSSLELLLFAYRKDNDAVRVIDVTEIGGLPEDIIEILRSPAWVKHAYNASFEWYCLNCLGYVTDLTDWQCTMVHGMYLGFPAGLAAIGTAIGLSEDKRKMRIGTDLINYFCKPCKPTKANGGRTRNLPHHSPEKWSLFKDYNIRDVETESTIMDMLSSDHLAVPEAEWDLWRRDVLMNAYGVRVDRDLIYGAREIDLAETADLKQEACIITGLENPNSNAQLLPWLQERIDIDNLQKATVADLLEGDLPGDVRSVLELRQQLGKTSTAKYTKMEAAVGADDRIRGLMQFYGATKTGRWAGRLVQVQNLPRNDLPHLDMARRLVKERNIEGLKLMYGNIADTLSQLIRTAFIPSEGRKFVVADFSAIEARVIAWLAGEEWVNKVFATHGKIYEATASQMFHVPFDLIKKGNPEYELRQKGKVATLALGYQGGTGALISMGALKMGLTEAELPGIVSMWRDANPNIVDLWYALEKAALTCVQTGQEVRPQCKIYDPERARMNDGGSGMYSDWFNRDAPANNLIFKIVQGHAGLSFLSVVLPSGRQLFYPHPGTEINQYGKEAVSFKSVNAARHWVTESTYGGKLTENIVQAIARDCLAVTLNRIWGRHLDIVFHVHDEVVIDAPQDLTVEDVCRIMAEPIDWAPGLVLKGAGFEGDYYKKD